MTRCCSGNSATLTDTSTRDYAGAFVPVDLFRLANGASVGFREGPSTRGRIGTAAAYGDFVANSSLERLQASGWFQAGGGARCGYPTYSSDCTIVMEASSRFEVSLEFSVDAAGPYELDAHLTQDAGPYFGSASSLLRVVSLPVGCGSGATLLDLVNEVGDTSSEHFDLELMLEPGNLYRILIRGELGASARILPGDPMPYYPDLFPTYYGGGVVSFGIAVIPAFIPEPSTGTLLGVGLLALARLRQRVRLAATPLFPRA